MKCPECGQWNRASMPHCTRCGAPLNIDRASRLEWKDALKDGAPSTAYLRADEFGQVNAAPDERDVLAREMQDLKKRKREGAEIKNRMAREATERPASGVVVTEESAPPRRRGRKTQQEPVIRIHQVAESEKVTQREAEIRHRVRFMDDTGVFIESRTYDPVGPAPYFQGTGSWHLAGHTGTSVPINPKKKHIFLKVMLGLLIAALLGAGGYFGWHYFKDGRSPAVNKEAIVTPSMADDLAAHTIMIPGEDGTMIYIRELHSSYKVVDGFATIKVADHTWYDSIEGSLDETMDITLTPFLKTSSGRQTPLDPIVYTITIPPSRVTLESPEALRSTVATTMATIKIVVRPGSHVTVNGEDCSDTVSTETGEMSKNVDIKPIGDNVFTIVVRSQYCRESTLEVVFYREPQEIPLDLAVGTYGTTDRKVMKVNATTMPGAYVEVTSPHSDLDITSLNSTGKFSFNALFDKIGDNTITIVASIPGSDLKPSVVEYKVYYLPPADEYTTKAWPMSADNYTELLSNTAVRASRSQVYEIKGIIQYFVSVKPQMAVIYSSEDGKSQPVLVRNYSKIKWVVGEYYRIFADAYSTYNSMPWLNGRYTYSTKKK